MDQPAPGSFVEPPATLPPSVPDPADVLARYYLGRNGRAMCRETHQQSSPTINRALYRALEASRPGLILLGHPDRVSPARDRPPRPPRPPKRYVRKGRKLHLSRAYKVLNAYLLVRATGAELVEFARRVEAPRLQKILYDAWEAIHPTAPALVRRTAPARKRSRGGRARGAPTGLGSARLNDTERA